MNIKSYHVEAPFQGSFLLRQFGVSEKKPTQKKEGIRNNVAVEHQHVVPIVMHLFENKKLE